MPPDPPHDTNRLRTLMTACMILLSMVAVSAMGPVVVQAAENDTLIAIGTEGSGDNEDYIEFDENGTLVTKAGTGTPGGVAAAALPSHDSDHIFLGDRQTASVYRWNRSTETRDWTQDFQGEWIRSLTVDSSGDVWVGHENGSVIVLDPDTGDRLSTHDFRPSGSSSFARDFALVDGGDELLIAHQNEDVVRIDTDTETVLDRYDPQDGITAVDVDEDGFFYVGGGGEVTKISDTGFVEGNISIRSGPAVRSLVVTEGNVFVGMGSDGVSRYDFSDGSEVWNNGDHTSHLALDKNANVIAFGNPEDLHSFNSTDGSLNWAISDGTTDRMMITNATAYSNVPMASDPGTELILNADDFMQHGSEREYSITFSTDAGGSSDITDEASVTSSNTSIVTVDESSHILTATGDTSVNGVSTITATYTDPDTGIEYTDEVNVTVAQPTMKNFKILPSSWRINALFSFDMGEGDSEQDTLPLIILISIFAGGITARVVSSFAGIGAMLLVIIVGWFGGWVGEGVVLSALFVGLFIGFNLAANIDYAVRR